MKTKFHRVLSFLLAALTCIIYVPLPICAEEALADPLTEYRYREKEFSSSKTELEEPWILYASTTETAHEDYEYVYIPRSLGGTDSGYTSANADSWKSANSTTYCFHGKKTEVYKYLRKTGYHSVPETVYLTDYDEPDYEKYIFDGNYWRFMYCTKKTPYTLYKYYKWSDWSEWSETPATPNDDREVETRTITIYTINYDANGGTGAPEATTKRFGETITVSETVPTRKDHQFLGWSTTIDGDVEYTPSDEYSANEDLILYAVWKNVTEYTVSYDANGGSNAPSPQIKTHDEVLTLSSDIPQKTGYSFVGWSITKNGEVAYTPETSYSTNASILLYAVWKEDTNIIASGVCGRELTWTLRKNGELVIDGIGDMYDYKYWNNKCTAPWDTWKTSIKTVLINDGVTSVGTYAFYWCDCIERVEIPNSVTSIGDYSFYRCYSLSKLTLAEGVTEIGVSCFEQCSFKKLTIPNSVVTIDVSAFSFCDDLTDLSLGKGINFIESSAFNLCSNLKNVWCSGSSSDYSESTLNHTIGPLSAATWHYNNCLWIYQKQPHVYSSGEITTQPTHNSSGIKTYTCSYCGTTKNEKVDMLPHTYGTWTKYSSSQHKKSCECGDTVFANHIWNVGKITTQPTHTKYGIKTYTCIECEETKIEIVGKLAHSYGLWSKVDDETHQRTCDCGSIETDTHSWDSGTITTQPTHTTFGERTYTCLVCSATKTEQVDKATGHSYGSWVKVDDKTHQRICSCGDVETSTHNWDTGTITTQPTHTTFGERTYTCMDCSATKTGQVDKTTQHSFGSWIKVDTEIHKRACVCGSAETGTHNWDGGTITTQPTHTTFGERTHTCLDCLATKTEQVDKTTQHSFGSWVKVDTVIHKRTCVCGSAETDTHTWDSGTITTQPTHTAFGTCTYTCQECSATKTEQVDKTTQHSYGRWNRLNEELHQRLCSCGAAETESHNWTGAITDAPTCSKEGSAVLICVDCYESKEETLPTNDNHTVVIDPAVASTCTTTGLTEGEHCSACSKVITAQTTIPELGHTEVVDAAVEPTCTAIGLTEGKHCSVCGEVITAQTTIPELGHTEVVDAAVAPTCTATGLTEGKHCSACGEVILAQTTIPEVGHTEVVDAAVEPTCTAIGLTEGKHCSVCSEVIVAQTTIPELGHTEVIDAAVAPTCTATGLTEGKHCSVCSEVILAQTTVPELGHTEVIDAAVAPTCTATGLTEGKHCSVCSEVIVAQTTIPELGHTEIVDAAVAPTCTATGLTEGSHCLVCSEILISQSVIPQLGHIEEKDDMKCDRCSISLFTVKASLTTDHSQVIIDIENLCNIQAQLFVAFYDECDRFMGVVITMPNAQSVTVPENMSGFTTCTVFVLDLSYKPLCPQIPVLEK